MLEQKNHYDEGRIYAVRCPSCRLAMNVPGGTLNTDKYIKCPYCGALGKTRNWVKGGQVCRTW